MTFLDPVWIGNNVINLILLIVSLGVGLFWLRMVYDCLLREFSRPINKIAWIVILIVSVPIGAAAYYYFVFRGTDFLKL
jgi:hypothetical protein